MPETRNPYLDVTRVDVMNATRRYGAPNYDPEALPPLDVPLLEKAREWVTLQAGLPEDEREWQQDDWVQPASCGTAFCVAGYVGSIIAGEALDHHTQEVALSNGEFVHVSLFAQYWLGLPEQHTDLFSASNDAEDINDIVNMILGDAR